VPTKIAPVGSHRGAEFRVSMKKNLACDSDLPPWPPKCCHPEATPSEFVYDARFSEWTLREPWPRMSSAPQIEARPGSYERDSKRPRAAFRRLGEMTEGFKIAAAAGQALVYVYFRQAPPQGVARLQSEKRSNRSAVLSVPQSQTRLGF